MKYFNIALDVEPFIKNLSDEDAGALFKGILAYATKRIKINVPESVIAQYAVYRADVDIQSRMRENGLEAKIANTDVKQKPTNTKKDKEADLNDVRAVYAYYKQTLSSVLTDAKLTQRRIGPIHARIKEYGVEKCMEALDIVKASDFLCGRKTDWKANFDWIWMPTNFAKIIEGAYNNVNVTTSATKQKTEEIINIDNDFNDVAWEQ